MPETENGLCPPLSITYDEGEDASILDQETEQLLIATAVKQRTSIEPTRTKQPIHSLRMLPSHCTEPVILSRRHPRQDVQIRREAREPRRSRPSHRPMLWVAAWSVIGGLLLGSSFLSTAEKSDAKSAAPTETLSAVPAAHDASTSQLQTRPIQDIRLGNRLAGRNPIRAEVELVEPDPATWRQINLQMRKGTRSPLWIELLRPLEWLESHNATIGSTIHLDLHEMGAAGEAHVTYIGPCPEIKPGNGTVVTGTFKHLADGNSHVIHLTLEGESQPTGVTSNHAYWSVDRQAFIEAGQLRRGELLNTHFGLRRVASTEPIDYTGFLYNLETTEHIYQAGLLGTLVHNMCAPNRIMTNAGNELRDLKLKGWRKGKGSPHYDKHGRGMGYSNLREYTEAAKDFQRMSGRVTENKVGNLIFKYDHTSERILIVSAKERTIVSFYEARDGILSLQEAMAEHWNVLQSQGH